MTDARRLADIVRAHPGLLAKRDLRTVARTLGGDGDDAALINIVDQWAGVVAAHAVPQAQVRANPHEAGAAGVVRVLHDMAATGARAMAILDTVAGPDEVVREVLIGLREAAARYGVPVLGGHTTITDDAVGLSTFAVGWTSRPLAAANARPGDEIVLLTCLDGELVSRPGGPVFTTHLHGARADRAAADLDLVPSLAEIGAAWSGRDVSAPGLVGSLLQMLESAGGLGCTLDVASIPMPEGVAMEDWLVADPTYGFLLAGDPARIVAEADAVGLTAAHVGTLDDTGVLALRTTEGVATVWNLRDEPLTGLAAEPFSAF